MPNDGCHECDPYDGPSIEVWQSTTVKGVPKSDIVKVHIHITGEIHDQ